MGNGIKEKIEDANKKAIGKVLASNPILVDVKPAIDVVPGMKKNMIMHAGTNERCCNGNFTIRRSC